MVSEIVARSFDIQEHAVGSSDIDCLNFISLPLACDERASSDQLNRIAQSCILTNRRQEFECVLVELYVFLFASGFDDLADLTLGVVFSLDDQQSIEQIQRHSVRSA